MTLENRIAETLSAAGIEPGDTVLVHSGMRGLLLSLLAQGRRDGDMVETAAGALHSALTEVVGEAGTIAVPGFFYEYGRFGTPFDAATSKPDMRLGGYSALMLKTPGMRRSLCPPVSIMGVGKDAPDICDTGSGYGYGSLSPWQRLTDLDAKMLFWDVSPRMATFIHHVEVLAGVPHIYNKVYNAPVIGLDGPFDGPVVSAVRYLNEEFAIVYELARYADDAQKAGLVSSAKMGALQAHVVGCRDSEALLLEKLKADPYYLLVRPPQFTPGEIPFDGAVGDPNPKLRYATEKISVELSE
ncbi:MAG: AAC(3) family N-acetyltransferase [Alphaproteobacteria bacterium]